MEYFEIIQYTLNMIYSVEYMKIPEQFCKNQICPSGHESKE